MVSNSIMTTFCEKKTSTFVVAKIERRCEFLSQIISIDEAASLRTETFAIVNKRGVVK